MLSNNYHHVQFTNFALAALTELPSVFIGEYICNRIGRRWSHVLCMTITTIFFAANAVIANGLSYYLIVRL